MANTTGNTITLANETDYSLASSTGFIIAGNALETTSSPAIWVTIPAPAQRVLTPAGR